jgi:hypothetical protein
MKRIAIVAVALFILSACAAPATPAMTPTPDPCSQSEITKYIDTINGVARRFDDAYTLANSTPRMSLPPVISDLQAIRRDTEDLKVPVCADKAKQALVAYMNATIESIRLFMVDDFDSKIDAANADAVKKLEAYKTIMAELVSQP